MEIFYNILNIISCTEDLRLIRIVVLYIFSIGVFLRKRVNLYFIQT